MSSLCFRDFASISISSDQSLLWYCSSLKRDVKDIVLSLLDIFAIEPNKF